MSNLALTIGGRSYTVACAPGEQAHVTALGKAIDAKLAGVPGLSGQSEARTLLYAALLLADELHEAQNRIATSAPAPVSAPPAEDSGVAEVLEKLAERLETFASQLESAA
jgi:cell division protein ZapA